VKIPSSFAMALGRGRGLRLGLETLRMMRRPAQPWPHCGAAHLRIGSRRVMPASPLPSLTVEPAARAARRAQLLTWFFFGALAAVLGFCYLKPVVDRFSWTAPLDDAYIHYQYAWNLARGRLFRYQAGDPYSTGETSPVYAVFLAVVALVRVSRIHLVAFAQLF